MQQDIEYNIQVEAKTQKRPDGKMVRTLLVAQVRSLAERLSMDEKSIEIKAIELDIFPERYLRNFDSFTPSDQVRLLQSRVAVVGLGGLGGTLVEWLARSGVGHLTLIDGDQFEEHNLNRQLLCTVNRLGTSKAKAAMDRVHAINSSLTVRAHAEFLTPENAVRRLDAHHVIVDCLDNISTRYTVEKAAKDMKTPFVSAAVAGSTGHITTIFPDDKGLELIYGPPESLKVDKGIETIVGNLPYAVGLIASLESAEVIKILLQRQQNLLRNKMLMVDVGSHTYEILSLASNKA